MAQHDYNIGDQNGFDFLVDLNFVLRAIMTNSAGSYPNPTLAHMFWFDANNDQMKVRNEANSEWVIVATKDGSGWTPYRQGTALGTASVQPDTRYAHRSNNLSDLGSATTARANLGVIEDSSDPDFTNSPNAAARRGLVLSALPNVLNAAGSAPMYACRAWVNFDGTGVVSIRASGNVSSITDNGTGSYTVNFTTAMSDTNYAVVATAGRTGFVDTNASGGFGATPTASAYRINTFDGGNSVRDCNFVNVAIFR